MHPQIDALFDEAENRYLKPEELAVLSQYVESLPARLDAYCSLRDREITIMQQAADRLVAELPGESTETLERSVKNALLVLRHCATAMLMNDEAFLKDRLQPMAQMIQAYDSQRIDSALFRLLSQSLSQHLAPQQVKFLLPMLAIAQSDLHLSGEAPLTATALF
ncbi:hypothetical protein P7L53_17090 [Thermoleptolyngbya sichuanensis XZ-Cy5]|uniref:hypothetical protein n=1 Tax=Thermoleptolyngbya sichuanensis TaxID=2885951 RepID=UPI00240DB51F|nr:hypothetical protein [Thermoleptolyngbya sichuanensis]MDG2617959.1 hypothetical protein [Thermoleptolyngbya sichuanensis XZ-Cy5]